MSFLKEKRMASNPETNDLNPHSDEMKKSCDGLRYDLKMCLLKSECVTTYKTVPRQCLQDPEMAPFVPDKCWALANAFFECKRSLIDMRRRFRGPKGY
jgi:cytochrome c oxidase assembly factor 5